jgi:hypothetical protein
MQRLFARQFEAEEMAARALEVAEAERIATQRLAVQIAAAERASREREAAERQAAAEREAAERAAAERQEEEASRERGAAADRIIDQILTFDPRYTAIRMPRTNISGITATTQNGRPYPLPPPRINLRGLRGDLPLKNTPVILTPRQGGKRTRKNKIKAKKSRKHLRN